jgi:hypothetical protein
MGFDSDFVFMCCLLPQLLAMCEGTAQTLNVIPGWRGDIIMDLRKTRCKDLEWCQVVGFFGHGMRPLGSIKTAQ